MRSNAYLFRSTARLEEKMMRLAMPKVSAADPVALKGFPASLPRATAPKPLTATIAQLVEKK